MRLTAVHLLDLDFILKSMDPPHGHDPAGTLQTAVTRLSEAMNRRYSPNNRISGIQADAFRGFTTAFMVMSLPSKRFVPCAPASASIYPLSQARSLEEDALMMVALLRRRINAECSPVYRLPSESLVTVASYLGTGDLFTTTHVSFRWRAALLSFPSLWSNIGYGDGYREEMLTMLGRSKPASLRVSLLFGCPFEEVLNSLCNNSSRITSLVLGNRDVLKKLFACPLPSLQALSIETDEHLQDLADDPAEVFPSLRALCVGDNIGALEFCVPHLTHFKFHGWYSQERGGKMLLSILGVFRRCPMLEVVDVGWGEELYNLENLTLTEQAIVSLPHLRHLTQEQYVYIDQPWLPDFLNLPQSCSIYLKKAPVDYNSEDISQIAFPFLRKNSSHLSDIRRVKLRMAHDPSEDTVEISLEVINGRGILLSFRRIILLAGVKPGHDSWAIIDGDINPGDLCSLVFFNTRSPTVMCLDNYQLRHGEGPAGYFYHALGGLGNVTTLILSNSAVERCLVTLEPDNMEDLQWCSTVHSLVIYSPSQVDFTGSDILQSLLRVSKKRKTAGAPFRSVTLAIPSTVLVSAGELMALNEYIERFKFLTGDDALVWDVAKYFIPHYDPLQRQRDESAFDVD